MIKISFTDGRVTDIVCDTPAEAAQVVSSMTKQKTSTLATKKVSGKVSKIENATPASAARRKHVSKYGQWMLSEVRYLVQNAHRSPEQIASESSLRTRHSPGAIRNAVYAIRSNSPFSKRFNALVAEARREAVAG